MTLGDVHSTITVCNINFKGEQTSGIISHLRAHYDEELRLLGLGAQEMQVANLLILPHTSHQWAHLVTAWISNCAFYVWIRSVALGNMHLTR